MSSTFSCWISPSRRHGAALRRNGRLERRHLGRQALLPCDAAVSELRAHERRRARFQSELQAVDAGLPGAQLLQPQRAGVPYQQAETAIGEARIQAGARAHAFEPQSGRRLACPGQLELDPALPARRAAGAIQSDRATIDAHAGETETLQPDLAVGHDQLAQAAVRAQGEGRARGHIETGPGACESDAALAFDQGLIGAQARRDSGGSPELEQPWRGQHRGESGPFGRDLRQLDPQARKRCLQLAGLPDQGQLGPAIDACGEARQAQRFGAEVGPGRRREVGGNCPRVGRDALDARTASRLRHEGPP